jgi:hypothetical protein
MQKLGHADLVALQIHGQNFPQDTDIKKQLQISRQYRSFRVSEKTRYEVLIFGSFKAILSNNRKAIPVTGRQGPWGCEISMLPQFSDNRLSQMAASLSQPYSSASLYTHRRFLILISVRG